MSDKLSRQLIKEYSILRKDYNKLFGINISISKTEQPLLSELAVNQLDIEDLKNDIQFFKNALNNVEQPSEPIKKKNKIK